MLPSDRLHYQHDAPATLFQHKQQKVAYPEQDFHLTSQEAWHFPLEFPIATLVVTDMLPGI